MNNCHNPKISVLIAVYNGEKFLREAIQSILEQSFKDFECIIINDASTDQSQAIIDSFADERIHCYINKQNIGLTKSLNIGLRLARGKYIARLDSDDIALPHRLEIQYGLMENSNNVLIGSAVDIINEEGEFVRTKLLPADSAVIKYELLYNNPFVHSSIFFLREAVMRIGGYDESYAYTQDYDLYTRLALNYSLANSDQRLVKYRIHGKSIGKTQKTKEEQDINRKKIMHAYINRFSKEVSHDIGIMLAVLEGSDVSIRVFFKTLLMHWRISKKYIRTLADMSSIQDVMTAYKRRRNSIVKNSFKKIFIL